MENWFENWCSYNDLNYNDEYLAKAFESEIEVSVLHHGSAKHKEPAWVRNHMFKNRCLKKYYRHTKWGGFYSTSMFHYYCPDPIGKPTVLKRVEGDFHWNIWAGPRWGKRKKALTNSRIRNMSISGVDVCGTKGRYLTKVCSPRKFD